MCRQIIEPDAPGGANAGYGPGVITTASPRSAPGSDCCNRPQFRLASSWQTSGRPWHSFAASSPRVCSELCSRARCWLKRNVWPPKVRICSVQVVPMTKPASQTGTTAWLAATHWPFKYAKGSSMIFLVYAESRGTARWVQDRQLEQGEPSNNAPRPGVTGPRFYHLADRMAFLQQVPLP